MANKIAIGIRYLRRSTWSPAPESIRTAVRESIWKRPFELTPRLALRGETQYDTRHRWEGAAALTYLIHKDVSLVGLQIRF